MRNVSGACGGVTTAATTAVAGTASGGRGLATGAAAGTVAEEARLVVVTVPVRVRCRACKAETEAASNRLLCGSCNESRELDLAIGAYLR